MKRGVIGRRVPLGASRSLPEQVEIAVVHRLLVVLASVYEPAAVSENLILHVDLNSRRVAPFAPEVLARIADAVAAHADLPLPQQVGRRVGLRGDQT